jgi:ketosteroid isomerase-like protein
MSAEENKALVRRFYEEIDKGNLEAMDELVAEDYVDHNPPPFPGLKPGREGVKAVVRDLLEGDARLPPDRGSDRGGRQGGHPLDCDRNARGRSSRYPKDGQQAGDDRDRDSPCGERAAG